MATGAWASEASELYKEGRKAEKAGHVARAYLLYSEAAALEPSNKVYWSRTLALQSRAAMESKVMPHAPHAAGFGGSAQAAASHQTKRRARG